MARFLPLLPLVRTFFAEPSFFSKIPRFDRVQPLWNTLDSADDSTFADVLITFYRQAVPLPIHEATLTRRTRLLRHAIGFVVRSTEPLARKWDAVTVGMYAIPGIGPTFWAAVFRAMDAVAPSASGDVGLQRLGRGGKRTESAGDTYRRWEACLAEVREIEPRATVYDFHAFTEALARMRGRDLPDARSPDLADVSLSPIERLQAGLRELRTAEPLRERLRRQSARRQTAIALRDIAFAEGDLSGLNDCLAALSPEDAFAPGLNHLFRFADLQALDSNSELLADVWNRGMDPDTPTRLLSLRDRKRFPIWSAAVRRGLSRLDDGFITQPLSDAYALYREAVVALSDMLRAHPSEVVDLLRLEGSRVHSELPEPTFGGFCRDTFAFLSELSTANSAAWMAEHRERYRYAVREPLGELCAELTRRYVEPVLAHAHGLPLDMNARAGHAISSVMRHVGEAAPYAVERRIQFRRAGVSGDAEAFVRVSAEGLHVGFAWPRTARLAGKTLRHAVQEHAERLHAELGDLAGCVFLSDGVPIPLDRPADLRRWAVGKELVAERHLLAADPLVRSEAIVGEILRIWERLLPVYLAAMSDDLPAALERRRVRHGRAIVAPQTPILVTEGWLDTHQTLLRERKQLLLAGVPGTGKTLLARQLACRLTDDDPERIEWVQFHPAFGYEEFVEGLRPRPVGGGMEYVVTDGILIAFAARAAADPDRAYVFVIDEINRGNLPRIFGELLSTLEYRETAVTLPASRRAWKLPANLHLIGTLNPADRSTVRVDAALRRRFAWVEMPPDARVLARWLDAHPPRDEVLAARLPMVFELLNEKLAARFGSDARLGHSHFMIADLDQARLRTVWAQQVSAHLSDLAADEPRLRARLTFDALWNETAMPVSS